jgi:O-antigen ligase
MGGFVVLGAVALTQLDAISFASRNRIWSALQIGCVAGILILATIEIHAWVTLDKSTEMDRTFHKIAFYGLYFASFLMVGAKNMGLRTAVVAVCFAVPTLLFGRTTGVNLVIVLVCILAFFSAANLKRFVACFVAAYCIFALIQPFVVHRLFQMVDQSSIASHTGAWSSIARLELWQAVAPQIKQAPLLGHGADTIRLISIPLGTFKYYDNPDVPSAHNAMVDTWYELGLVGVLVLIASVVMLTREALRSQDAAMLTMATVVVGTLVELAVDHRLWLSWVQGALIFAFLGGRLVMFASPPNKTLSTRL